MAEMSGITEHDPVSLIQPDCRLFVDTNVFMDTDPRRQGGLKRLFERCAADISRHENPIVVPTKVVDELKKHSTRDSSQVSKHRAKAFDKATNALRFIQAAETQGLIRPDLGDGSNPYADDLFAYLFKAFGQKYNMCLLTNDITLQLRIRVLAAQNKQNLISGRITADGLLEIAGNQALYESGLRKLAKKKRFIDEGRAEHTDRLDVAELEPLLAEYQALLRTSPPDPPAISRPDRGKITTSTSRAPTLSAIRFADDPEMKPPDQPLAINLIPGEGDEVHYASPTDSGTFTLKHKLGEGGEGSVFDVGNDLVVKVFDREHLTLHRKEKIDLLVSRSLDSTGICFPSATVTTFDSEFVGYIMRKARGQELSKAVFKPMRFKRQFPDWTKVDLVDVGIAFLEKVAYLHSLNVIIGDINPKNLMVDEKKDIWIIDADSWQLEGFPCPVGTEMFSTPQVLGKSYSGFLRTRQDEQFAIATMLFMILITGQFPYARAGTDGDIPALIKEGIFSFQFKEHSNRDQPEGKWKFMWSHLSPRLKEMFWNTFHRDGTRYSNRPSVEEWLRAMHEYKNDLVGPRSFDPMSIDVFPTRFKAMSADTPLYECERCGASMAGKWNKQTETYFTPPRCFTCMKPDISECADCHKSKPASSLTSGRCNDCNHVRNYGACSDCGTEKRRSTLQNGRCYECKLLACRDCNSGFKKADLVYGRCPSCQRREKSLDTSRNCTRCGKPFITYGHIDWHRSKGKPIPTSHKTGDSDCRAASLPQQRSRQRPQPSNAPPSMGLVARISNWFR